MRQALAIVAAVLVLGGAVGGAYWWLLQGTASEADVADPAATVDAYLDAWAAGDGEAMRDLVRDPPETFVDDLAQLRDGLDATTFELTRTDLTEDVDGRATTVATVTAEVPDVGPITWEVALRLLRERGEWGIAYEPTSLHPDWRPGLRFAVTREEVEREPILARDGTVLAGPGDRVTFGFEPAAIVDRAAVVAAFDEAVAGSGETAARLLDRGDLVDGWFYPVVSVPAEEAREARSALTGVPGVVRRTESGARGLLADGFARQVIGRVAEATAEQLEQLGAPYERGDEVGQFGLEAVLERRLAGGERITVTLVDGSDAPVGDPLAEARVGSGDAEAGPAGPVTTTLDVAVQRAVENTLLAREDEAAIVVVDAADGAVRAVASRPLDGFDRALQGRYPPGEVFAVVAGEAAIAEGDAPGAGVGAEALTAAAERFGFGVEPDLPLAAFGGSFPDPGPELAGATRGQARIQVSPLHLASVAAAVAGGTWHAPYLLEDDGPGESRALAPGALDGLGRLLEQATPPLLDGTGATGIAGTARGAGATHVWFLGTIEDGAADLGVAVLVEDGGEDADAAAIGGGLAERLVRELRAVRDAPADLGGDDVG